MILAMRTDNPEAELALYDQDQPIVHEKWHGHRQLAETIHIKLRDILAKARTSYADITGIIFYEGPGSFTGLRIGASIVNAIAFEANIPIAAVSGEQWIEDGLRILAAEQGSAWVAPEYGAPPNVTTPRK